MGVTEQQNINLMAKDNEPVAESLKVVSAGRQSVVVGEVYRVNFSQIFSDLAIPSVDVFGVTHTEDPDASLCAYLLEKKSPFRYRYASVLKNITSPYLHKPLYWGAIQQEGQPQKLIVIAQRPAFKRLVPVDAHGTPIRLPLLDGRGIAIKYTEEALIKLVVQPILEALKQLDAYGVAHRGINPKNIFLADEAASHVVLGASFLKPAGYDQPPIFEPFDTMLADPLARGEGNVRHDIYALGVTTSCYLLGIDLVDPAIQADFMQRRLVDSTYNTILGTTKISSRISELLKGTLHDDAAQRWTIDDVEGWIKKNRPVKHQQMTLPKPSRAFEFQGQYYPTISALAAGLGTLGKQAVDVLSSQKLEVWLVRTNNKPDLFESLKGIPKIVKSIGNQALQNELYATFALQVFEKTFPLFYKKKAFVIDGFGAYLCSHFNDGEIRTSIIDLLGTFVSKMWLENQDAVFPERVRLQKIFEKLPSLLQKKGLGYGPERVLYELNQGLACQSDLTKQYFLENPAHVLPVLEAIAAVRIPPMSPLDKHLTAFLAVAFDLNDKQLYDLNDPKENRQAVGLMNILVHVDKKTGSNRYPFLCQWVADYLGNTRKSFFSVERQKSFNEKIQRACKSGKLNDILQAIDVPQEQMLDEAEFAEAQRLYEKLFSDQDKCKDDMKQIMKLAREKTHRYAPIVSAVLAIVVAIFGIWMGV